MSNDNATPNNPPRPQDVKKAIDAYGRLMKLRDQYIVGRLFAPVSLSDIAMALQDLETLRTIANGLGESNRLMRETVERLSARQQELEKQLLDAAASENAARIELDAVRTAAPVIEAAAEPKPKRTRTKAAKAPEDKPSLPE